MYENLAILVAFIFLYSIINGGLERTPISGAIVYTSFGLIFGPLCLGLLTLKVDTEFLRTLAELSLALVLFTDAANANLGVLKKSFHIPQRLLLVGLPLTILLGFGVGVLVFKGLTLLEVAILATMLAPTDAALGKAVVTNKSVPANIREGLNVESGLNDGICVPIIFLFLALASSTGAETSTPMLALKLVIEEIGIGVAVGCGLTFIGVWLIRFFGNKGWISETWRQLPVVALALACFAFAQWLGGSGFIASFVGGMLFGRLTVHNKYKHQYLIAAEGTGDTFVLLTWVAFGSAVVGHSIDEISWNILVYAILSLTLIRMVPVFLVLTKMNLRIEEKLFIGWFGPRGLASIVFGIIVINRNLPGGSVITMTVVCTIVLSIIAHGLTANPLIAALVARLKRIEDQTAADQ
jgi:NhaP-type Na+/H+ or K+/H+ antiporter